MSLKRSVFGNFSRDPSGEGNGIYRFRCVIWPTFLFEKGGRIWEAH
jgi:hypothetical protein